MNPATAFATVFADELVRCGLREVVLAPGSRSGPLAMEFFSLARAPERGGGGAGLRLHVRIDERSAAFLALGLAKASRRPAAVLCTSGTAAASFHPAVIEAAESGVPLLVLTADRPPELRGTGANQTIDQVKLYGSAVRWFCDLGVPEARAGQAGYWRSLACRAWAHAFGGAGGLAGPVHLNLPLREPLVPESPGPEGGADGDSGGDGGSSSDGGWPESLDGRPGGAPWTAFGAGGYPEGMHGALELPWTERGAVVCGDGDYDAGPLLRLAEQAGWPVLAEPSSGARRGPNALRSYSHLLASPEFAAAHVPDVIVSAGRPGLSRGQLAFLRGACAAGRRHVVIAQGPGCWADPARTATDVVPAVRLAGPPGRLAGPPGRLAGPPGRLAGPAGRLAGPAGQLAGPAGQLAGSATGGQGWLAAWQRADRAASRGADEILDGLAELSEPRLARDLAAALPAGSLLWAASSMPIRDLDQQMTPRDGLRVMASRGASGIDGLVSSAIGAALAHQAAGGGAACALLGDLAFLHDCAGLVLGPEEPRPDLCLVVVNNDGGGIFSGLEQAAYRTSFERVFGTPHGAALEGYAAACGIPYTLLDSPAGLPAALWAGGEPGRTGEPGRMRETEGMRESEGMREPEGLKEPEGTKEPGRTGEPGRGLRIVEVRTSRDAQAALRCQVQATIRSLLASL